MMLLRNTAQALQPQLALTEGPKSLHCSPYRLHMVNKEAMPATTGVFPLIKHKISKMHFKKCCYFGDTGIFTKSIGYAFVEKQQKYLQIEFQAYLFPDVLIALSLAHCIPSIFSLGNSHLKSF